MRLFLDTEFTSPETKQLISIGIISEDGQHSFYAELNEYDASLCNRFVCENVLPHLEHIGMSRDQLASILHEWFATLPRRVFFSWPSNEKRFVQIFRDAPPAKSSGAQGAVLNSLPSHHPH